MRDQPIERKDYINNFLPTSMPRVGFEPEDQDSALDIATTGTGLRDVMETICHVLQSFHNVYDYLQKPLFRYE
jgi:hypothetical protein